MDAAITPGTALALAGTMFLLALFPSTSSLAVAARASASGFFDGLVTAAGVVAGDIVYILIAVLGLSALSDSMGEFFIVVKLAGGAYLIWLGISLLRGIRADDHPLEAKRRSGYSSFLTGLLITLADQKAVLFYLGFFPAFFDLAALTRIDILVMVVIAAVSVGGAKSVYALAASRLPHLLGSQTRKKFGVVAGAVLTVIGLILLFESIGGLKSG